MPGPGAALAARRAPRSLASRAEDLHLTVLEEVVVGQCPLRWLSVVCRPAGLWSGHELVCGHG
jgi:hypothetical protein